MAQPKKIKAHKKSPAQQSHAAKSNFAKAAHRGIHAVSHAEHAAADAGEKAAHRAVNEASKFGWASAKASDKWAGNKWGAAFGNNPFANNPFNLFSSAKSFGAGAEEAKKVHERVREFSREGMENFARSADSAAKKLGDVASIGKENFEAIVESANIASQVAKDIGAEISEYTNNRVAENFRAFEEFLHCKTVNDFLNLHSNLIKNNINACFNESLKLTELLMELGKAAEPVTSQASTITEKFSKVAAA